MPTTTSQCYTVSPECPVDAIYGYLPNPVLNVSLVIIFLGLMVTQITLARLYGTRPFAIAATLGCLTEVIGYISRTVLCFDPYSAVGFKIQFFCLSVGPTFLTATIFLLLKPLALTFGPIYSRIPVGYYSLIFLSTGSIVLVLQTIGIGLAVIFITPSNPSKLQTGISIMAAGIAVQTFASVVVAILVIDYIIRAYQDYKKHRAQASQAFHPRTEQLRKSTCFRYFTYGIMISFLALLVRDIYRLVKLEGSWVNETPQIELEFWSLDGIMCVVYALTVTAFYPSHFFALSPPLQVRRPLRAKNSETTAEQVQLSGVLDQPTSSADDGIPLEVMGEQVQLRRVVNQPNPDSDVGGDSE